MVVSAMHFVSQADIASVDVLAHSPQHSDSSPRVMRVLVDDSPVVIGLPLEFNRHGGHQHRSEIFSKISLLNGLRVSVLP